MPFWKQNQAKKKKIKMHKTLNREMGPVKQLTEIYQNIFYMYRIELFWELTSLARFKVFGL